MMMHIMSKRALCAIAVLIACGSSAFGAVSPRESLSGTLRQLGETNPLKPNKSIKGPKDLKKFAQKLLRGKRATSPTRASSAVSPQALTKVLRDMGKTPLYREIRSIQEFKKFAQAPMEWLRAGVLAHQEQVRREAEAVARAEAERLRQAAQPSDISLMNFTPLADPRPTPESLMEFPADPQPESLLDFGPEAPQAREHLSLEEMRAWALKPGGSDQPRSFDTEDQEALERAHAARKDGEKRARKEEKARIKAEKAEQEAAEAERKAQEKAARKARKEADRVAREAEQKQREEQERANEREEERRRLEEENRDAQQRREQAAAEEQRQKEEEARKKQERRARKEAEEQRKKEEAEQKRQEKQRKREQKRLREEEERKMREAEEALKKEEEARIQAEEALRKAAEERQRAEEAARAAARAAEEQLRIEQVARERAEQERLRAERSALEERTAADLQAFNDHNAIVAAAEVSDARLQTVLVGKDIHARDYEGNTPLHTAARAYKPQAVERLLNAGANPMLANNKGNSPIQEITFSEFMNEMFRRDGYACQRLLEQARENLRSSSRAASPVRQRSGSFDTASISSSSSLPSTREVKKLTVEEESRLLKGPQKARIKPAARRVPNYRNLETERLARQKKYEAEEAARREEEVERRAREKEADLSNVPASASLPSDFKMRETDGGAPTRRPVAGSQGFGGFDPSKVSLRKAPLRPAAPPPSSSQPTTDFRSVLKKTSTGELPKPPAL